MNHLRINHTDNTTTWHPTPRGWRIDSSLRCIVVKSETPGTPATWIPLDNVSYFTATQHEENTP